MRYFQKKKTLDVQEGKVQAQTQIQIQVKRQMLVQMVKQQFGCPQLIKKIILDVTTSDPNHKFSIARAYRVCRTVEESVWPRTRLCNLRSSCASRAEENASIN